MILHGGRCRALRHFVKESHRINLCAAGIVSFSVTPGPHGVHNLRQCKLAFHVFLLSKTGFKCPRRRGVYWKLVETVRAFKCCEIEVPFS